MAYHLHKPSGVKKHKNIKFDVEGERLPTKYIEVSWTDQKELKNCIASKQSPFFWSLPKRDGANYLIFQPKFPVSHVNSKHPCILCHWFIILLWQFRSDTVSTLYITQALLLNSFFETSKYLLLPLKWSVHDTCILSTYHLPIFLFAVIHLELPIAWTFLFYFSRRFNLAGVDCSNGASCSKGG